MNHTFVICAYKESPYLTACIDSLKNQTKKSRIILVTSTPCDFITEIAKKYEIPLFINEGEKGITQDWNFGYSKAETEYVTIAHQDDVYKERYTEEIMDVMQKAKHPLIAFSDYSELHGKNEITKNQNLKIKRMLLSLMRLPGGKNSVFLRRRMLSLGNPICCPSVTFAKHNLPDVLFQNHFRSNEDWEAWEMLSRNKGSFLYIPKVLMSHRIHADSETSAVIRENQRGKEDYEMFLKFWPQSIAKMLTKVYGASEKSNGE